MSVILSRYRLASENSKLSIIQIGENQLPSMSFLHVSLNILLLQHILFSNGQNDDTGDDSGDEQKAVYIISISVLSD